MNQNVMSENNTSYCPDDESCPSICEYGINIPPFTEQDWFRHVVLLFSKKAYLFPALEE